MQKHTTKQPCDVLELLRPRRMARLEGYGFEVRDRHEQDAQLALQAGEPGRKRMARYLRRRLADARILRLAWYELERLGVRGAGPDGLNSTALRDPDKGWLKT